MLTNKSSLQNVQFNKNEKCRIFNRLQSLIFTRKTNNFKKFGQKMYLAWQSSLSFVRKNCQGHKMTDGTTDRSLVKNNLTIVTFALKSFINLT